MTALWLSILWAILLLLITPCVSQEQLFPTYLGRFHYVAQAIHRAHTSDTGRPLNSGDEAAVRMLVDLPSAAIREAVEKTLAVDRYGVSGALARAGLLPPGTKSTSELCVNHSKAVLTGLKERQGWALQMLDAIGRPVPGVTELNLNWPGAFALCQKVRANTSVTSSPFFSGKYCTATALLPSMASEQNPAMIFSAGVLLGLCVPDSCSELDLELFVSDVLMILNVSELLPGPVTCEFKATELDARALVAVVILSLFAILVMVGTALDMAYVQFPKWYPGTTKQNTSTNDGTVEEENQPLLPQSENNVAATPREIGLCIKILISFSVWTNASRILSTAQPPNALTCVHGVRFLSMTWVVFGHAIVMPAALGQNAATYFVEANKRWTFQAVTNATVSVDSFFVLSGLLVSYLTLKELKRKSGRLNWFLFYFHRFWRLTPVYMICIMIYVCLMRYWGEGPFWPKVIADRESCEKYWWTNLLYVNNLFHNDDMCFGHSWYLANDMQFYILSPLIFLPLYFFPAVGMGVSVVFLLVTSITPGVLSVQGKFPPGVFAQVDVNVTEQNTQEFMSDYYVRPYNRMGPYIIGMLAGFFLYKRDCKWRPGKAVNLSLWAVATACALAVLFGLYDACNGHPVTVPVAAFYNAVNRQVWGACVAWVVVACCTGNGGVVNTVLSWSGLVPLSRLTYTIYLIHLMLLGTYIYNSQSLFYFTDINVVVFYLGMLVASYMAAFVVSLVFESPMMALEKVLLLRWRTPTRDHRH